MNDLGSRIAALRKTSGQTLQEVADASGLSRSFVSQVERGESSPSIGSLKSIVEALGVALGDLFDEPDDVDGDEDEQAAKRGSTQGEPDVQIVRAGHRKRLVWPDRNSDAALLTPNLQRKLEVLLTTEDPSDRPYETAAYEHDGEEFGYVLEGTFEVTVCGEVYVLEAGDSIYYSSHLPHSTRAIGDQPATTLWVITPPTF